MEVHLLDATRLLVPPGLQVVVADSGASDQYSAVDTDQLGGTRAAVEHLVHLGHRTVWHRAGPPESCAAHRRARAWRGTLAEPWRPAPEPGCRAWWVDS